MKSDNKLIQRAKMSCFVNPNLRECHYFGVERERERAKIVRHVSQVVWPARVNQTQGNKRSWPKHQQSGVILSSVLILHLYHLLIAYLDPFLGGVRHNWVSHEKQRFGVERFDHFGRIKRTQVILTAVSSRFVCDFAWNPVKRPWVQFVSVHRNGGKDVTRIWFAQLFVWWFRWKWSF